jgi:transposase
MRPLSEDLRRRIVAARKKGEGESEVCRRFGVSRSSVARFWKQQQRCRHCRPKQIGGYRKSRLSAHGKTLRQWIRQQADLTLVELQQRCREQLKVTIGLTALWHRLDRLGLSYKKNDPRRRATAARRQSRAAALAQNAARSR